jgi:ketosteroid isomerase-like protein
LITHIPRNAGRRAAEDRRYRSRNPRRPFQSSRSGPPARADAGADIRLLEERFVAALKTKDLDAIMKVYAPDQTLVVFDVVPPRQHVGAAAYRKDWQTFFDSFEGPITVELSDLDVAAGRNLAYSHSIQHVPAPTSRARNSISSCG